MDLAASL